MKEKILSIIILLILIIFSLIYPVLGVSIPTNNIMNLNKSAYHYFTYTEMTELLHDLEENNSDIMMLESIGTTFEGRDIWMIKLSDNVQQNENEPGVLFMAAHHGNEKASFIQRSTLKEKITHRILNCHWENKVSANDFRINWILYSCDLT